MLGGEREARRHELRARVQQCGVGGGSLIAGGVCGGARFGGVRRRLIALLGQRRRTSVRRNSRQ